MEAVNFAELDALTGELLPERTVLSTITGPTTPFNNYNPGDGGQSGTSGIVGFPGGSDTNTNVNTLVPGSGGNGFGGVLAMPAAADHGSQVASSCQSTYSPGSEGLLGLGIGPAPVDSQSCAPASETASW